MSDNQPYHKHHAWYHEPWAWLVFILPFSAVVAGISTVIIANVNPDSLVVGDYYKKGKAINITLDKIKLAQKLGMRFDLKLDDNRLTIRPTGIEKEFPVLNVNFYHATLADKDFSLSLTADGHGNFTHQFAHEAHLSGKWHLNISSFKNNWKIAAVIHLPQPSYINIAPQINETE